MESWSQHRFHRVLLGHHRNTGYPTYPLSRAPTRKDLPFLLLQFFRVRVSFPSMLCHTLIIAYQPRFDFLGDMA